MQSFKLFLTFAVFVSLLCAFSAYATSEPVPAATTPEASAVPDVTPLVAPDKPREYFGYSWPFADRDMAAEIGPGPIVVELFTTQGCIFCPVADKFFTDLVAHTPGVIGLACHVTYLNVKEGNLSNKSCTDRQFSYTKTIPGGSTYTPQIVVNGRKETFGFQYEPIYALLKDAIKTKPSLLSITKGDGDTYSIDLPAIKVAEGETAELQVFQYRRPTKLSIADGPNQNMNMEYHRSVSSITTTEIAGKKETVQQTITPEENSAGAVVMTRVGGKIMAVGEIKFE